MPASDMQNATQCRTLWLLAALLFAACTPLAADEPRRLKGHTQAAYDLAFFPEGNRLVSAGFDHTLRLWDLESLKLTRTFTGHEDLVLSVAVSSDGSRIASGSLDRTIRLWDVPNDSPLQVFENPGGDVLAVAVSTEGDLYATSGADRTIRIRKTDDHSLVTEIKGLSDPATHLAFRPDGEVLAGADAEGRIVHYHTKDGSLVATVGAHQGPVSGLAYSRLGDFLLSTGHDGLIKQWYATPRTTRPLAGHEEPIRAVAATQDGTVIATASADKTVRLWNQKTGRLLRELTGHEGPVEVIAFTTDDSELVTGSSDKTVRIFDVADGTSRELMTMSGAVTALATTDGAPSIAAGDATGALRVATLAAENAAPQIRELPGHAGSAITGVGFVRHTAEGPEQVVSSGADKSIKIWDLESGKPAKTITLDTEVHDVSVSSAKNVIAAACGDHVVRLYDINRGELENTLAGHTGSVRKVHLSASGNLLVSISDDGTVRYWNVPTGLQMQRFEPNHKGRGAACLVPGHSQIVSVGAENRIRFDPIQIMATPQVDESGTIHALAISLANRTQFLTAGEDGRVRQWNLGSRRPYRVYTEHNGPALAVAISPTNYFASGGKDGIIQVFRTTGRTGALRRIYVGSAVEKLAFSNDNRKLVAVGADNRIRTYDPTRSRPPGRQVTGQDEEPADPEALQVLVGHTKSVNDVAIAPDSKTLYSASRDGTIRTWTVAGADGVSLPKVHTGAIYSVDFRSDDKRLVSGSADESVQLWSMQRNRKIGEPARQDGAVYSVRYSPDGKSVLTAAADGRVLLLEAETGRAVREFAGPREAMYCAVFSDDGKQVAAAGTGLGKHRTLFVWDVNRPKSPRELRGEMDDVYRVQFNNSGSRLMAAGYSGHIHIWDLASKQVVFSSKLPASLFAAAYSPDGAEIAAAGNDGTVFLIDVPENAR